MDSTTIQPLTMLSLGGEISFSRPSTLSLVPICDTYELVLLQVQSSYSHAVTRAPEKGHPGIVLFVGAGQGSDRYVYDLSRLETL